MNPKNRKTSIEEAVKHTTEVVKNVNKQLTDLAVTISADENVSENETSISGKYYTIFIAMIMQCQ